MVKLEEREPTYCSVQDVEEILDIPTPGSPNGETLIFTDVSHPSISRVKKYILSAEDMIDKRLRKSWRENVVRDYVTDIRSYQHDEASWRAAYYTMGGNVVELRKDMCEWNPNPRYSYYRDDDDKIILKPFITEDGEPRYVQERSGDIVLDENGDPKMEYVDVYEKKEGEEPVKLDKVKHYVPLRDGELQWVLDSKGDRIVKLIQPFVPQYEKLLYSGDKMEMRNRMNEWLDVSNNFNVDGLNASISASYWFDYKAGRLFIRSRYFAPRQNSIRITYRYGSTDPVPLAINELCSLLAAKQVINNSAFMVKFGVGGDMANVRDGIIRNWDIRINEILSSFQRSGSVHSWSR